MLADRPRLEWQQCHRRGEDQTTQNQGLLRYHQGGALSGAPYNQRSGQRQHLMEDDLRFLKANIDDAKCCEIQSLLPRGGIRTWNLGMLLGLYKYSKQVDLYEC